MNRPDRRRFLDPRWPVGLLLGLWAFAASASAPPGRYTIPGDGTVHDTKTGLVWQQAAAPGTYTWSQASSYCGGLSLPGTGWRLPSVKELMTLVDFTVAPPGPTIDSTVFSNPNQNLPAQLPFWSSSPLTGNAYIGWAVDFGVSVPNVSDLTNSGQARCVR